MYYYDSYEEHGLDLDWSYYKIFVQKTQEWH